MKKGNSINNGVTPSALQALERLAAEGPILAHSLHIFARGRLFKLGLARKMRLPAPHDGIGGVMFEQLHYEITEAGKRYLMASKKGASDA